jgi:hypothetical protein
LQYITNLEYPIMVHVAGLAEVPQLAKAYLLAKSAFNRAYCEFWHVGVEPCPDETGWKMLELFRNTVQKYRFRLQRKEQGIEQAAWELFRLELVGDADYQFDDAVGFVKWYEALTHKVGRAIGGLFDFHGDSFGDLIDSFPLAGRELVQRALATHPKSERPRREGFLEERELHDAVREKLGPDWHKLICAGENYVVHALQTACYKCYLHRICTGRDPRVTWSDAEQKAVDFASQYDA